MSKNSKLTILLSSFTVLLCCYYLIYIAPFFPNENGGLGHDYALWFPRMLTGVYYFENNSFSVVPWFTPSFCGGNVFFADPQNLFFSIPQLLNFYFEPVFSVILTFMLFAVFGLVGSYLLAHHTFHLRFSSSIFAAALFLFNGFYAYRIIIGHLSYHSFMLIPLICYVLLQPARTRNWIGEIAISLVAAMLCSYVFYSGGIHLILPLAFSVASVFILFRMCGNNLKFALWRSLSVLVFTMIFCAAKLNVAFATLNTFSRDYYPLSGIDNIFYAFWVPIKSLFISAFTVGETNTIFTNSQWAIERHELELSLTIVPLILILWGLIKLFLKDIKISKSQYYCLIPLVVIFSLPIAINFYTPEWNALLKQTPILKNSVTLVRWYALYIPIIVIVSSLILNKFIHNRSIVFMLIALVIFIKFNEEKSYYAEQSYNPDLVIYAHDQVMKTKVVPKITEISSSNRVVTPEGIEMPGGDGIMAFGLSQINCSESLFGYRNEEFKQKELLEVNQLVTNTSNKIFNLKNPACYVFPNDNNCNPGDHFRIDQEDELLNFVNYKGFNFNMPVRQHIFNWMSLVGFVISSVFLVIFFINALLFRILRKS